MIVFFSLEFTFTAIGYSSYVNVFFLIFFSKVNSFADTTISFIIVEVRVSFIKKYRRKSIIV